MIRAKYALEIVRHVEQEKEKQRINTSFPN